MTGSIHLGNRGTRVRHVRDYLAALGPVLKIRRRYLSLRPDSAKEGAGDVVVVRQNENGDEIVAGGVQSEIISYEEVPPTVVGTTASILNELSVSRTSLSQLAGLVAGRAEDG